MPRLSLMQGIKVVSTHEVDTAGVIVGRSRLAGFVVATDTSVSRFHARVRAKDGRWWVEDLSSTNGLRVGQRREFARELANGDLISLGTQVLRFELGAGEQAPLSPPRAPEPPCLGGPCRDDCCSPLVPLSTGTSRGLRQSLDPERTRKIDLAQLKVSRSIAQGESLAWIVRSRDLRRFTLFEGTARIGRPGQAEIPVDSVRFGAVHLEVAANGSALCSRSILGPRLVVNGVVVRSAHLHGGERFAVADESFAFKPAPTRFELIRASSKPSPAC